MGRKIQHCVFIHYQNKWMSNGMTHLKWYELLIKKLSLAIHPEISIKDQYLFSGLGFLILNVILPMVLSETRPKTVKFVRLLCLLFPSYGLSDAINGQGTYYFWKSQCKNIESAIIFGGIDCGKYIKSKLKNLINS